MKHISVATGAVLAAVSLLPSAAHAQVPCTMRDDLVQLLASKYKEGPVSFGTANGKAVVEIFASETGTFTIIATRASGLSCIIAAGQDWEELPPVKPGANL